jgi:predicted DNA-binding antitoxin AbrB/MazE fold protein
MSQVEAIFQGGVFRPTGAVDLPENQRGMLKYEPAKASNVIQPLENARRHREAVLRRRGPLGPPPDSTPLIREDRDR